MIVDSSGFEDVTINASGEIIMDRQARYEQECEKGYFLQPIYVQKLKQKIYLHEGKVNEMMVEFRDRIELKRKIIERNKLRCKEYELRDTIVICERCKSDLGQLKNFVYESHENHYARCSFGFFSKVSLEDAKQDEYADDREFVELYEELWEEEKAKNPGAKQPVYAFSECIKRHIVGIVRD